MSTKHGQPRLVVGVGASAGGFAALKQLLSAVPDDSGMAYVLVQHLRPHHDSSLTGLLASSTKMPVVPVEGPLPLAGDTVYVIRPDTELVVRGGQLEVRAPTRTRGLLLPIDHLFDSLAREWGTRAAGIVLSGAGSDGSGGLRAIKAAGGLTIAQEPTECAHGGMPQSAIDAGLVELVLPIASMPNVLARFASLPASVRSLPATERDEPPDEALSERDFRQLAALFDARLDLDLSAYKRGTVERRVLRRMALSGYCDIAAYLARLAENAEERDILARDLLISVTDFFRDPPSFSILREAVVEPAIAEATAGDTLRAWVPGCATGEEAYSIAIEYLEAIAESDKDVSLQIFATDIDEEALAVARAGIYPTSVAKRVSERRLRRYFQSLDEARYQVRQELRGVVSFAVHDLTKDPPFPRIDLVSCRNVLIYLTPTAQQQVLKGLHFALKPDGCLFLGASETAHPQRRLFASVSKSGRIYRKVGASVPISVRRPRHRPAPEREGAGANARQAPRARRASGSDLAQRAILRACAPPTVVVAHDDTVLFMHGELTPYLRLPQGGNPRLELSSLLRPELATRTRGALYRARHTGDAVDAQWSAGSSDGDRVRITARPAVEVGEGAAVLSFEAVKAQWPAHADRTADDTLVEELEKELHATRDDLYQTVAELETSNEELRSTNEESTSMNEELQSANEELEATTEELRSLNEELTTVNAQLRDKVQEVEQAHDDLDNFFASTRVATLFLDEGLRVKRFTSAAAELLGIDASDIGRFIGDIAREPLQNDLDGEARAVLEHLAPRVRELRTEGDRWIARQVLPFRTATQRIEGAVVTFIDVTELKSATERLAMRERQQAVVARIGLLALKQKDLQGFMDQAVREVQQALETDYCKVLELQPGGESLLLRAGVGWRQGLVGSACVGTGSDSQAGFTLRTSEPVIVDELARERRFSGPSLLREHDVVSGMSCVIRAGDHNYGVLGAHTSSHRIFTTEDANFLQSVATVVGSAIAHQQARLRLAVERGVSQALAEPVSVDDAIGRVLESLFVELGAAVGELWWRGDDADTLTRREARAAAPRDRGVIEAHGDTRSASDGGDPIARAFAEARAQWHAAADGTLLRPNDGEDLGLVTALVFPVLSGRDVLGVVSVLSRERLAVDEYLLRSLEGVGRLIGDFVARSEVEARARLLAAITESSHDAILSYDMSGRLVAWLSGSERLFGYSAEEILGSSIERIVPEELREELWSINSQICAGEVVEPYETTRIRSDGQRIEVSVRSSPIRDREGNVVGISSADRDVGRQKEAERKLVAADRQKDAFLAMLGHELRNPLAAIRSVSELLKRYRGSDPKLSRVQAVLERQTLHMGKLLDGLLDVSRIIRGKIELAWKDVDLVALCCNVIADTVERMPERKLDIRQDLPDEPVWAVADPVRVAQIVDNVLSNAIKYTASGGTIDISLRRDNGTATLSVRDTGVGIEPELMPYIFDVFRQSKQGLDRSYGGLGIGLALVKSLAELHGGSVTARSEGAGCGAELVVTLPVRQAEHGAARGGANPAPGPLDILLIEDNEDAGEMLRQVLELVGHRVEVVSRGQKGLDRARAHPPDLVLCDLGLPGGMSGFDVARELRADPNLAGVRLVAVSGYGRPDDKSRGAEVGFDAHITKPVDIDGLQRVLAELAADDAETSRSRE